MTIGLDLGGSAEEADPALRTNLCFDIACRASQRDQNVQSKMYLKHGRYMATKGNEKLERYILEAVSGYDSLFSQFDSPEFM